MENQTIETTSQGSVIVPSSTSSFSPHVNDVGTHVPTEDVLQLQLPNDGSTTNQIIGQLVITTDPNGQQKAVLLPNDNWGKPPVPTSSAQFRSTPTVRRHTPVTTTTNTATTTTSVTNGQSSSQASVPKFNGVPSATNRATDRLKNQHHEELRRRASYQRVLADVKNASETPQEPHLQQFSRPTDIPPVQQQQPSTAEPNFQIQNLKPIKKEAPQSSHSTDDSDADDTMSPTGTPIVQIATAPTDINQRSPPVLVHLGGNQGGSGLYSNANLQNSLGLPSYTDMSNNSLLPTYKMGISDMGDIDDHSDPGMGTDMIGGPVAMVEEAARKREVRLLKNREAARECRRKKKEYIKCLENRVQVLESQNKALIDELKNLKEMYCITKQ